MLKCYCEIEQKKFLNTISWNIMDKLHTKDSRRKVLVVSSSSECATRP